MAHLNIEIKARSGNQDEIRKIIQSKDAFFKGIDHQIDTYFNVNGGRLKLREGNIENHLIYYMRENISGPKQSNVILYNPNPGSNLKEILIKSLGILGVVDKQREIYFLDNVKFHIDKVNDLGDFVEIEAIDIAGKIGKEMLYSQCNEYLKLFSIKQEDLISRSYSDMLLNNNFDPMQLNLF